MRAYDWIQQVGFPQVNVDLIAGMIGETDENWTDCVERVAEMEPDNITIYQMELPFNTLISQEMREQGIASPVADWPTKRRWVNEAIDTLLVARLPDLQRQRTGEETARPTTSSIATTCSAAPTCWRPASRRSGTFRACTIRTSISIEEYLTAVDEGRLPINRALTPTPHQLLIRELVLQLKEGRVSAKPFREKFGVDVLDEFAEPLANQQAAGYLDVEGDDIRLTREGLLQVDTLLPEYFEEEHRAVRYT